MAKSEIMWAIESAGGLLRFTIKDREIDAIVAYCLRFRRTWEEAETMGCSAVNVQVEVIEDE